MHFFHAAHKLWARDHHWRVLWRKGLDFNPRSHIRYYRIEELLNFGFFLLIQYQFWLFIFLDEVVDGIRIHPYKHHRAQFVFQLLHEWPVDHRLIHDEDFIAVIFAGFNLGMLGIRLVGVDEYRFVVLVGLRGFYLLHVFFDGKKLAFQVFHQSVLDGFFVKLLVAEHAVFDEDAQITPFGFKVSAVFVEQFAQFIRHFFGDESTDSFHVAIGL